jgi:hypothetical protein
MVLYVTKINLSTCNVGQGQAASYITQVYYQILIVSEMAIVICCGSGKVVRPTQRSVMRTIIPPPLMEDLWKCEEQVVQVFPRMLQLEQFTP